MIIIRVPDLSNLTHLLENLAFYPHQDFNGIIDFNITLSVAEGSVTKDFVFCCFAGPGPACFSKSI